MLGQIIGMFALAFVTMFCVGTAIGIVKEIRSRRKAAACEDNKAEEKEVEKSNEP